MPLSSKISRGEFRSGLTYLSTIGRVPARWTKTRADDVVVMLIGRIVADEPTFQALCDSIGLDPDTPSPTVIIGKYQPGQVLTGTALTREQVRDGLRWIESALGPIAALTPNKADNAAVLLIRSILADDKVFEEFCDTLGVAV